jgi:outer membrane lipoprotein-sorting protein
MSRIRKLVSGAGLLMVMLWVPLQAAENELGWTLDSALKQVERQSKDFSSLLADISAVSRSADGAIGTDVSGRLYMNKDGDIRIRLSDDSGREMLVTRSELQEYNPGEQIVERYSLSKHKDRVVPYARLGFTTTGKDLKDDYLVTMLGEDSIRGERVLILELTPKSDRERQIVGSVALWINESSWMPMRQVIKEVANNETLTIDYQGAARNLNLNPELFKANWPRGTKRVSR